MNRGQKHVQIMFSTNFVQIGKCVKTCATNKCSKLFKLFFMQSMFNTKKCTSMFKSSNVQKIVQVIKCAKLFKFFFCSENVQLKFYANNVQI